MSGDKISKRGEIYLVEGVDEDVAGLAGRMLLLLLGFQLLVLGSEVIDGRLEVAADDCYEDCDEEEFVVHFDSSDSCWLLALTTG